jgi:HEPN domain-containing protein/predicted nucleotidyltransferase
MAVARATKSGTLVRDAETSLRTPVTEELLADITRRIVEAVHPYKVILFGSRARGTPRADSDIDLLVIMDADGTSSERYQRVASVAKPDFVPMDLLVYTPAEVETRLAMRDFFIGEILEKGRVLYDSGTPWEKLEVHLAMTLLEEWIGKAEADYQGALVLNRQRKVPLPDLVCYLCQQCAEKYLKAFLIHQNAVPDRTHELPKLLSDCAAYDPTLTALLSMAQALNPYSVDPRYPGVTATVTQAQEALKATRSLRRTMRKKLGL